MPMGGASRSLTARLLLGVGLPMVVLAIALGLGGTLMIRATVGSVNDRILAAAARGIADSLTIESGAVTLDLSPAIFGMLENAARDNVYYSIRQGDRVLTGYADLPRIARVDGGETAWFADARYLERDVRIVALVRRLPGMRVPLVIEVAETLDARRADARRLLAGLFVLEAALIAVAVLLLPLSVRWGLRPVIRVRGEIDRRAATDLAPVPLAPVPSELRDLVRAFNAMLARLGDTMAAMRRFTGDASHQMRTPLSILRTHVAVLRIVPPDSAEARQSIDDIDAGSVRLSHLIGQLLALARADNAVPEGTALERVDLRDVVAAAIVEQREAAMRTGVDLVVVPAEHPVAACTARELARELLANLIDNAIRHGGGGGIVRIAVGDESGGSGSGSGSGGGATVTIEDEGPGIPAAERDHVFGRFTRLTPYGEQGGSGLGLSIARSLAQAIRAEVRLEDGAAGRGLRVVVAFPTSLEAGIAESPRSLKAW